MHAVPPPAEPPPLELRSIARSFGGRAVLDGVDLLCASPGIVGIVGPNGAGKTTLLRVIAQLVEPDSGTVTIAGRVVERSDDAATRALVGWAPHEPLAWRDDSVRQNLNYACRLAGLGRRVSRERVAAALDAWQLADVASDPVRRLSRGWAQRYSLARADLIAPPILLLDEPTTGLDADARTTLEAALETWRSTRVVLVASHERAWLDSRADQLLDLGASAAAEVIE